MPKVVPSSSRRLRAHHHAPAHPQSAPVSSHAPILSAAPRKVSFEDGHQSSSSFTSSATQVTCSTSCSSIASSLSKNSSKSSLRRKAPSVCLVGLASQDCLSPTPSVDQAEGGGSSAICTPSSPWGHFVDILVPLDEEEEPRQKKRLLGDNAPLFGFFEPSCDSNRDDDWSPLRSSQQQQNNKKHKKRWGAAPHPYAPLQPRHHHRRRRSHQHNYSRPSFLPGFFLPPADRAIESSETQEVEEALERLQV